MDKDEIERQRQQQLEGKPEFVWPASRTHFDPLTGLWAVWCETEWLHYSAGERIRDERTAVWEKRLYDLTRWVEWYTKPFTPADGAHDDEEFEEIRDQGGPGDPLWQAYFYSHAHEMGTLRPIIFSGQGMNPDDTTGDQMGGEPLALGNPEPYECDYCSWEYERDHPSATDGMLGRV